MIDIGDQQAVAGLVHDQPQIAVDPHRPEIRVLATCRCGGTAGPCRSGSICRSKTVVFTAFCSGAGQPGEAAGEVSAMQKVHARLHPEHLHHLVAEVVDHLHRDPARLPAVGNGREVSR